MRFKLSKNISRRLSDPRKSKRYKKTVIFLQKRPFLSFFVALGLLLLVILFGNVASQLGQHEEVKQEVVKTSNLYSIGSAPKVTLQAKVDQEGIIEVIAQTPGIVSEVYVMEGDSVYAGQTLAALSSNYQGGNAPGLQASLAGLQYKNVKETYDTQKDIIAKQREIAEKSSNNTEELRKISDSSESDTKGLLEQNEAILSTLSSQLDDLKNSGSATEAQILQAQQLKAQVQAGVNQLRSALKGLEYSTNTDNPPTQLSNLQKDISLKQLDLQQKALDLSKESSRIQYNLALIQASLMRPATPFDGVVEKVNVTPGQSVNPGTVIAVISSYNPKATLTVMVPFEIAQSISRAEPSTLHIGNKKVELVPAYVSTVATNNLLHTILFNLPEEYISKVGNNSFIPIDIPVGYADSVASVPFIPIDSVFQSQNASYVFVLKNGKAESQSVELGTVYGSYVEIVKGIKNGDKIILNRTVVDGEKVTVSK